MVSQILRRTEMLLRALPDRHGHPHHGAGPPHFGSLLLFFPGAVSETGPAEQMFHHPAQEKTARYLSGEMG